MSRSTFMLFVAKLFQYIMHQDIVMGQPLSPEKRVAVSVMKQGTPLASITSQTRFMLEWLQLWWSSGKCVGSSVWAS